eukprot:maker-scaffold_10-snap-gene-4.16-mRNA-1 protein AED:0.60 eAED:0.60 QI:0/0/0/0.5/0/0/2/0/247
MNKIVEQHGHNWLCPQLISSFQTINVSDSSKCILISVELWDDQEFVAGEIGFCTGTIYTSLTGFAKKSSKSYGSIQLYSLKHLLLISGFKLWDLGMSLEYKKDLGAVLFSRNNFLSLFKRLRNENKVYPRFLTVAKENINCKEIFEYEREKKVLERKESSKNTMKYRRKVERKEKYSVTSAEIFETSGLEEVSTSCDSPDAELSLLLNQILNQILTSEGHNIENIHIEFFACFGRNTSRRSSRTASN